jgi:hypothetical protein
VSGRKVSLADLADRSASSPAPTTVIPEPVPVVEESVSPQQDISTESSVKSSPQRQSTVHGSDQATPPVVGEWRRYDQYERKETRLREDQYKRLSETSRRLNKARRGNGERITENTLIRVAIDLLLANEVQLSGTSEAEIRTSLGL